CDPVREHRCGDGRCIPSEWLCDGDHDCLDNSDELNCSCKAQDLLECENGQCIPSAFYCDGDNDCKDGSDEENCTKQLEITDDDDEDNGDEDDGDNEDDDRDYDGGCTTLNFFELHIIGSPGESALLSCHCPYEEENITDGVIWTYEPLEPFGLFGRFGRFRPFGPPLEAKDRTAVSNERGPYTGRVCIFDQTPSSNRSLLISNLTRNDQGQYLCGDSSYVILIVTGCSLSENQQHVEISRSPGESVFLPCSCTDLEEEPVRIEWRSPHHEDLHSTELSHRYSGRVQMFNENFPGNLSLLISNLTKEDHGLYSCWINHNQHRNFSLTVKVGHDRSRICMRKPERGAAHHMISIHQSRGIVPVLSVTLTVHILTYKP
ncbi:hypothetical protein P4O66_020763, partial [Electrophorus voltai]